ncbi:hypothetical protein BV898_13440 [Hypsibius exemplaris]|uniref:BACK domain-containing protein n=1 Tax=Hypsibius exemplaris TaxID=2072580 RepID=A0A1W0WAV8_HYPEX|nr:hypothetical protein BV898_13440 [Hypsibius exemplaris]
MAIVSKDLIIEFISVLQQMRHTENIYDTVLGIDGRELSFSIKNADADVMEMIVDCSFKFSFQPLRITECNLAAVLRTEKNTKLHTCMKYQQILWQLINDDACLAPADASLLGVVLKYVIFFISKNFPAVSATDSFKVASAPEVASIISIDDLNVCSEDLVLAAVRGWYCADPVAHHEEYLQLLQRVRWPLLSRDSLENASNDEAIWLCPEIQELMRKSFQYQLRDADNRGSINFGQNFYLMPRRGMLHR